MAGFTLGFVIGSSMGLIVYPIYKFAMKRRQKVQRDIEQQMKAAGIKGSGSSRRIQSSSRIKSGPRQVTMNPFAKSVLRGGVFFGIIMGVGGVLRCKEISDEIEEIELDSGFESQTNNYFDFAEFYSQKLFIAQSSMQQQQSKQQQNMTLVAKLFAFTQK